MPQIEEVQMVHWGSLRPDPVPLLTDGINMATGPNGSGKTCFLDGLKLLLGVTEYTAGRTPAKYIFDGGPEGTPADRAYLRATFANPVTAQSRHRVFAWAGYGCEDAEHVTIACVVTGQERFYLALPGRIRWGVGGSELIADLEEIDGLPRSRRLGPRQYDDLLDRAGVTKALRSVLALPQGATDRLIDESPAGMLRRLLELTGKQTTLEEFRHQREAYEQARADYSRTLERFRSEQRQLELLDAKAQRHEEWVGKRDELVHHDAVLLPAAHYRDRLERRDELAAEVEQRQKAVDELEVRVAELGRDLPQLQSRFDELTDRREQLDAELADAREELSDVDTRIGRLEERRNTAREELAAARELAGDLDLDAAVAAAEQAATELRAGERRTEQLTAELEHLQDEIATLRAGRPVPPDGLRDFVETLTTDGIDATVLAEVVDLPADADDGDGLRVAAEAALGNALWAVVVPAERYEEAVHAASETGHRWPVARAGNDVEKPGEDGAAVTGVLSGLDRPEELAAALAALDLPAGDSIASATASGGTVVDVDGVRYGPVLSQLAAPEQPVLGRRARERRLAAAEQRADTVERELEDVEGGLRELRDARRRAEDVAEAVRRLPELGETVEVLSERLTAQDQQRRPLAQRVAELDAESRDLQTELGRLTERLGSRREQHDDLQRRLDETRRPQLRRFRQQLEQVAEELAGEELSDEQARALDDSRVPATEVVERDAARLRSEVDDHDRYPEDVRDELILGQRDSQAEVVVQVDELVSGRQDDLDEQQRLVEEARARYQDHVRAVVRLLNREFGRICEAAQAEGEIRTVPGDRPDELGVEVRVAHRGGEAKRSYRDPSHSGGQRAKIAILILLAAMGVGGAADLLIMDEHIAHLDSTNIDHIAELMRALRARVQFVLATPTNAEAQRLGWADVQLAFLPRSPGTAYTPPVRVMTRLEADDLEDRFADAQLTLS